MSDFTIIALNTIDSTNNYAMQLIDANKAYLGLTITAQTQTGGKGQRGRVWADKPGSSVLMSIILTPELEIGQQFLFNSCIAVAIAKVLQKLHHWPIHIKWPNDIIINDKKAGGILIENVFRGSTWLYSVVGIGINVQQDEFPAYLPHAISLKMASGIDFSVENLIQEICEEILALSYSAYSSKIIMNEYNRFLYKKGESNSFSDATGQWQAMIVAAHPDGTLEVQKENGERICYQHGQAEWVWG